MPGGISLEQDRRTRKLHHLPDWVKMVHDNRLNPLEIVWSAIGATIAIALSLWFVGDRTSPPSPILSGRFDGLSVCADRHRIGTIPRIVRGSYWIALIGIVCYQVFGDGLWVSVAAVVLTLLLQPVGVGVFTLFLVAILWSRVRPGKIYPNKWW